MLLIIRSNKDMITSVSLLLLFLTPSLVLALRTCSENETMYTYTECDADGGRWSVQVPANPDECEITKPNPPIRGQSCGFSCKAGHFLNLSNQTCQICPAGTYSLGSGVRFDSWDKLPDGFSTSAETVTFNQYGYTAKVNNCSSSSWKPSGHYIVGNDDDCTSSLSYAVNLKQPGVVSFNYQYSDTDIIFHFFVQNSQCQTSHDNNRNVFLNTTGTDWRLWKADLQAGPNVLSWKTTGIMVGDRKLNPVRIRDIEITGVSYTTECHKCRAGYFSSSAGAHWCNLCAIDTYSDSGAFMCTPCDTETEYAPRASDECYKKPACQGKDYFTTHTPCDENKTTSVTYEWVEPKICLDDLEGSVSLPPSGQKKPCASCNPGFHPTTKTCKPCPVNTYSNGTESCTKCPASTSPHYGLFYLWWHDLPPTMKTSCISLSRNDCDQKKGWNAVGDKVRTISTDSGEAYLILVMKVGGYMEEVEEGIFGRLTFVFQLKCDADCQFYFMKDLRDKGTSVIQSWRGNQARQTFFYDISTNDTTMSITWAFQKGVTSDSASIFLVNVTNVMGSSADSCVACASGKVTDSKCIPCPSGEYLDVDTHSCKKCSGNTVLNDNKDGCTECGPGTEPSPDHERCNNDCQFVSSVTKKRYDFSKLSGTKSVSTLPTFTNSGRKYNHVYNFSICGNEGKGLAQCIDNVTFTHSGSFSQESIERVFAMACRSTAVPTFGSQNEHITVHSQPTMVSDKLASVTQQENVNVTHDLAFPKDDPTDLNDVVYHMSSNDVECENGRNAFVYLRCSPDVDDGSGKIEMQSMNQATGKYPNSLAVSFHQHIQLETVNRCNRTCVSGSNPLQVCETAGIMLQSSCPDGTCDGCAYHFLWRSMAACPICTEDDYKEVVGACKGGVATTTYLWKRYPRKCRDGVTLPESTEESCPDYTFYIELGVVGGIALLVFMCIMVCCLWKKKNKLEYKYQRLVVNEKCEMNGGELAGVDTCAISDSESDFEGQSDEVIFQKKKSRLFGKKKVNDYNSVNDFQSASTTGV